jgi:hypothetical protein
MANVYPTGSVISIGNTYLSTVPPGFLLCDGREVSRSLYFRLFQVIGTTYGVGDNATTFNLPDLREAFSKGVTVSAMQSDAGTYFDGSTSFLGASFDYNLGLSAAESIYTNPTGISTFNTYQFSGTPSSAGEHSHSYYFNLDQRDWGAGCRISESKDNLNPPNRNAVDGRIWYEDQGGTYRNDAWYHFHFTSGRTDGQDNQFGHANSAGRLTHTCRTLIENGSQNPCYVDQGPGTQGGLCSSAYQIIIGSETQGNGKSQYAMRSGDHKHIVLKYFQLQQGQRISSQDPGFGEAVGNNNFDPSWASERITTINEAHTHGSQLTITPQAGIDHDLFNDHQFTIDPIQTSFVAAPGYPGAGTQNASGQTAPSAIALGWAIKY